MEVRSCLLQNMTHNMSSITIWWALGSLLYWACWSRTDLAFAVFKLELSRLVIALYSHQVKTIGRLSNLKHFKLLQYLKGTKELGLKLSLIILVLWIVQMSYHDEELLILSNFLLGWLS